MSNGPTRRRTRERREERATVLTVLLVAFSSIVVGSLSLLVRSSSVFAVVGLAVALVTVLVGVLNVAGRTLVRQVKIALIGPTEVGKTLYATTLFDYLQTQGRSLPFGFAPTSETIDRVHGTLSSFSRHGVARTPSDYLYLYSARLAFKATTPVTRFLGATEYDLQLADAAGEQLAEFIPGGSRWNDKTSYYQYAVDSQILFLFVEYPADDKQLSDIVDRTSDLIFVIQDVCEANGIGPTDRLSAPVAIIISKCDRALDDWGAPHKTDEAVQSIAEEFVAGQADMQRLIAVADARCRAVRVFGISSTGPLNSDGTPISGRLQSVNVDVPLRWALERRYRRAF